MCADADLLCERLLSVVSRRRRRAPIDSGETQDARMERVCMLRALIKYLPVELNEREEGMIPLQQAVLLEDPIHPAQALRSGHNPVLRYFTGGMVRLATVK